MKKIKVLGPGCAKCNLMAEEVVKAAMELGIQYDFEKISDMREIMRYGVMMTPALVVDGKVKVSGKVPSQADIKKMLQD